MVSVRTPRRIKSLIGEIVIIGAQLDHLATMALMKLTKMDPLQGLVLTDKMSISTKFSKIQYLVEASEDVEKAEFVDDMMEALRQFLRIRNSLAHGLLFERWVKDFHFLVTSDYMTEQKGESYGTRVAIFDHEELRSACLIGENMCNEFMRVFEVRTMPEIQPSSIRSERPPTPRSLRKMRDAKSKPPPGSSEA